MSATGDEIVTLSQLKEVYDNIVNRLPSSVTFSSSSNNTGNINSNDKQIKWSSMQGDTNLAHLSSNTIVIAKQANYTLSFNTNLEVRTYSTGNHYVFSMFVKINNSNKYTVCSVTQTSGTAYIICSSSIELGALNPGATIDVYVGYSNSYGYPSFDLVDEGSMCTLKSS